MTTGQVQENGRIFVAELSPAQRDVLTGDIARSLFFLRLAQVHLSLVGKAQSLRPEIKTIVHRTVEQMRTLDQKIRSALPRGTSSHLTAELSKDKLWDIAAMVDASAKVDDTEYGEILEAMTQFLKELSKGKKVNPQKYVALFKLITTELKAEGIGNTTFEYLEKDNSIIVSLGPQSEIK